MEFAKRYLLVGAALLAGWQFNAARAEYQLPSQDTKVQLGASTEVLAQISSAVSAIAASSKKALVFVSVARTMQSGPGTIHPFDFFFGPDPRRQPRKPPRQEGVGSGFFIDLAKGYLLTNNHVIEGADTIGLKLANGETYDGKVIGRDANTDIAVVQVVKKDFNRQGLAALVLGNSDKTREGSFVVALGAPFGLESSISFGVVSAVGRGNLSITTLGDFIQTDAAINPGNSGGPLLGVDGRVVGINTAIASKSGGYSGIGFAVPSNLVRTIAASLVNDGGVQRGYIGIYFEPLQDEWAESLKIPKGTEGAIISKVVPGGPADKAGLESGDVIIKLDNRPLQQGRELSNLVGFRKPGDKVRVDYYRSGKLSSTTLVIDAFPGAAKQIAKNKLDKPADNPFGMATQELDEGLKRRFKIDSPAGVVIVGLDAGSVAAQAMLQPGDVILAANGTKVSSPAALNKILQQQKKMVLLHIERRGSRFFVSLNRGAQDNG